MTRSETNNPLPPVPKVENTMKTPGTAHIAAVGLTVATALVSGCSVNEVTRTVNGTTVSAPPETPRSDIDPCDLDAELLERLGLDPTEFTSSLGSEPTCEWGSQRPRMHYWVTGPSEPDPTNTVVTVAGQAAEIYVESDVRAAYILRYEDITFEVRYFTEVPTGDMLSAPDGAELVVEALVEKYQPA